MQVERLSFDGVAAVAVALAEAFDGYEWTAHTVAADDHRERMRATFEAYLRLLLVPTGTAWTTPDGQSAALWSPPEPEAVPPGDVLLLRTIVSEAAGDRWDAAGEAEALLAPQRPTGRSWVLESLGTAPAARRSGHATALVEDGLARADADGVPTHLETCGDANVAFYERFGFEVTATTDLPDGPTVLTMVRAAVEA
jgi:ribosomal protein S18 acetylase RimI-like enzyme